MASSTPTLPRKTSLDEEPLLPTYEQFQTTDQDAATLATPPEITATADQIPDFLVHLLTSKRGLALDHARRIASKWTIGNGKELRNYPPSMYLDIFGREDGWVVYKEVKLCIMLHEKSDKPTSILGLCVFQAICLAALGGIGYLFYRELTEGSVWATFGSAFLLIPILFLNIGCASSFSQSDPETKIESELQECMKKYGVQQT